MDRQEREYHWQKYYDIELEFLHWISCHSNCVLSLDEFDLSNINSEEHPQFIRQIHVIQSNHLAEAQDWSLKVRNKFVEVTEFTGESKQKLPSRLPQIYTDVVRIIHSNYPAYQSIKLKRVGECDLFRTESYSSPAEESVGLIEATTAAEQLITAGLSAYVRFIPSHNCHAVTVQSEQFHRWSNCSSIQRRLLTGQRYEARITSVEEQGPVRTHLGLILVCQDKQPFVEESLPRKKRSDAHKKTIIQLPINTKYTFFSND